MKPIFTTLFILFSISIFSQEIAYSSFLIPKELIENANSVVRNQEIEIEIVSRKEMIIKKKKVITVFNNKGINNIDAIEFYDKTTKVKDIEAIIYNSFGKELKKIKRKDFVDQSIADGFSIYRDDRKLFLDYTPTEFPFTIVYNSEIETSNTAFIPSWFPIDDYYESVEKSSIRIKFSSELGFKYKEKNFIENVILKQENANEISFITTNLVAEKYEELSPSFTNTNPSVMFGLDLFNLEGLDGSAKSWNEFGNWYYSNLLSDNNEVSIQTQNKIKELVQGIENPIEKARIIYKYVQDKTRYVSIQLGIGGWKPMMATDVDRLGYGDCKALTNYTRVLLKSVGIESYCTLIYGGKTIKNIEENFVSTQGNHMILAIPNNNNYTFLECTSQTSPFGFQGDFTDDRYALIVKPEGGEIVKTNNYNNEKSKQITKGNYSINEEGSINASLYRTSTGNQYDNYYFLERATAEEIDKYYKYYFNWINNLKIEKVNFKNNNEDIIFNEELDFRAINYVNISGNLFMFPLNAFTQNTYLPAKYRNRKSPFEIPKEYQENDEIEISLPSGFSIDSKPDNFELNNKFGTYKIEISIKNPTTIIYKRFLSIKKGEYENLEYENYTKFQEQINKYDNAKIVLIKK